MNRVLKSLFFFLFLCPTLAQAQQAQAGRGIIDLRHWDFEQQGSIRLDGEWEFYMSELIAPDSLLDERPSAKDYISFPSTWNDVSMSKRPGNGFATYHLKVLLQKAEPLALELPHFYSNFKIWINGVEIAKNGQVGTNESTSVPQWLPQTVSFQDSSNVLHITIQASNFHHAKGGVRESLLLGKPDALLTKRQIAVTSTLILISGLALVSLVFFLIYLFTRQGIMAALFALLCITWAIRTAFSNLYVITSFFPDLPWELCVKIEYMTLYFMMIWAIFFLANLFPHDVNTFFKNFLFSFNLIFIAFTLFVKAALYTQFLPVYLSFCLILLLYCIYVLIRAVAYERHGAWLIIGSIMMGVAIFAYDLIAYQQIATFNPIIINLGYFIMYGLLAACLAYQFGFLKRSLKSPDILSYEDLYGGGTPK